MEPAMNTHDIDLIPADLRDIDALLTQAAAEDRSAAPLHAGLNSRIFEATRHGIAARLPAPIPFDRARHAGAVRPLASHAPLRLAAGLALAA